MAHHEARSEPERTTAFPAAMTELDAFRLHDSVTRDFTDALREGRCRQGDRFRQHLSETVGLLAPLVGPWNLEILFALHVHGAQRFSALKRALPGVSSRVLTDKLRALGAAGLVARQGEERSAGYALSSRGEVVARHLHPIVFYLRNHEDLDPPTPG